MELREHPFGELLYLALSLAGPPTDQVSDPASLGVVDIAPDDVPWLRQGERGSAR